jgi:DNA-binding CsgD family transcriptional regulator
MDLLYADGRIVNSGPVAATFSHVLRNLNNAVFRKIITLTDQAIMILNHFTDHYDYVSENIPGISGFSVSDFTAGGSDFTTSLSHPDDLHYLASVVYPQYKRCLRLVAPEVRANLKFAHTFRLKKADGIYIQCVQQSIPISFENDALLLELLVISDISAFKKDDRVGYKVVFMEDAQTTRILSQGSCDNSVFSLREGEILGLTARGFSEKQIADKLSLSPDTIKTHRKNMFRKAGVRSAAELVRYGTANLVI